MRKLFTILLALLSAIGVGCGGGGTATSTNAAISGPYEFVVTSNVTGGTTLIEANFTANGSQSSASGPGQSQILTYENKTWYVNGVCAGATPGQNSVTANVSGGHNVTLSFDEGGNTIPAQGTLAGTVISGNYSVNGSSCPDLVGIIGNPPGSDSEGFTATPVPNVGGTYTGTLNLTDGTDNAAITLQENSDHSLNANVALTGLLDNGKFSFSGSAVGNTIVVSGMVNGRLISWIGYIEATGRFTGTANSILIFDQKTLATAGLLLKQ